MCRGGLATIGRMSIIHRTTMLPRKLELLAAWLPTRDWYLGGEGRTPVLANAGGFRLDDPEGEVGMEFMVAADTSGERPVHYHVPLTYRGAPLEGAEDALIGTSEHGVLGKRWVYDGTHDPVLIAQMRELFAGRAQPQMQSVSDTPDPSVVAECTGPGADGRPGAAVRFIRVLDPAAPAPSGALGHVTVGRPAADGTESRVVVAVLLPTA